MIEIRIEPKLDGVPARTLVVPPGIATYVPDLDVSVSAEPSRGAIVVHLVRDPGVAASGHTWSACPVKLALPPTPRPTQYPRKFVVTARFAAPTPAAVDAVLAAWGNTPLWTRAELIGTGLFNALEALAAERSAGR